MIKILIDGDACPVVATTEKIASEKNLECHIYCDTSRIIESDYSSIHIVDKGADATDFAIIRACGKNDIVITNDSGLAAMILSKKGIPITSYGMEYTDQNIMSFLNRRFMRQDAKRRTKRSRVSGCNLGTEKRKPKDYQTTLKYAISKAERKQRL